MGCLLTGVAPEPRDPDCRSHIAGRQQPLSTEALQILEVVSKMFSWWKKMNRMNT